MSRPLFLMLIAITFLDLGCLTRSSPQVFHTLRPLSRTEAQPSNAASTLAIEVMPVRLPEALQRPQLMIAVGPGTLELSETHRWGNGLDKDMQRVLVENLSALLGSDAVVAYPYGERVKTAYRLEVDFQRCDGQPGGLLTLQATWMVTLQKGGPALVRKKITLDEPVSGQDLEALVAAHSRIMEKLSRDIADELNAKGLH